MTTSTERAQALANEILARGMVPIISVECRALIAQAIREAEDSALDRAAVVLDGVLAESKAALVRSLKSQEPSP